MDMKTNEKIYHPGMYTKTRPSAAQMADHHVRAWKDRQQALKADKESQPKIANCISFSRKIGVGALEIADLLSEKMGISVVDREILEYVVNNADLRETTAAAFDERYPGIIKDIISMFVSEKSFMMEDYLRHLTAAVYSIAEEGPTIFVGRATHLILPRDHILAVRFISSTPYRIKRIMNILKIDEAEAKKVLDREDKQQREFFKKNFNKKDATPYEFDIVINLDYCKSPQIAAEVVAKAYEMKFGWSS